MVITYLNIDQLKLEIYGSSTKKENKSIGVNRSRSDNERFTHTLLDIRKSIDICIYIYNRIYTYSYICVYIHLDTCESKYTYARIESACTYV